MTVPVFALFLLVVASATEIPVNTIDLFEPTRMTSSRAYFPIDQYTPGYTVPSYHRFLTTRDMFEKPMFLLAPTGQLESKLTMYYLFDGLKSVSSTPAFEKLHQFMKKNDLYGVVFYPQSIYNSRLFDMTVHETVLPDKFKVSDVMKTLASNDWPILYIVPKAQAQQYRFESVKPVVSLGVYDDVIEPIREPTATPLLRPSTVPAL